MRWLFFILQKNMNGDIRMSSKTYTNEELLEILKKQFELNPNTVASDFRAKYGLPYYQVYIKRFGGFTKAKYLAGITSELKEKSSWSKEIIIQTIKNVYGKNKYCSLSYDDMCKLHDYLPSIHVVLNYFTSLAEVLNICKIITLYNKPKEYLIHELQRFVNEFNRLPTYNDFETSTGYPSRKTFDKYFTNVDSALIEAGYGDYKFIRNNMLLTLNKEKEYETMTLEQKKVFLINTLYDFVEKYNHVPTGRELDENINYLNKGYYRTVFNKYNNALIEAGLELNSVSQYEDKFLKQEFLRFVDKHGRIPYLHEFNVSEYPSFWCYQNRFGSWNKAVIAYGFEPNDSDTTYYLDNGEKCMSRYEWDISRWLLKKRY